MKRCVWIPNSLTIGRIVLTVLLDYGMITQYQHSENRLFILFIGITGLIYGSDLLDGRLARRWDCTSGIGERLDVVADLFYILSQDIILIYYGKMSGYLISLVILEFAVFILTSAKCSEVQVQKRFFFFETIGRSMAVYYYLMPLIYVLLNRSNSGVMIHMADYICIAGTVIAISNRVHIKKRVCSLEENHE